MKRAVGYLFFLLLLIYLYFMYDDRVISGILVLSAGYPAVSAAYLFSVRRKLKADLERVPPIGEAGEWIRAGITLENFCTVSDLRYECTVVIRNRIGRKQEKKRFQGVARAGGKESFHFRFKTENSGCVKAKLQNLRIYDPPGIFCVSFKCGAEAAVKVMPEFEIMPVEITRKTREFQTDAEVYSGERKGDDPSELYQVREYRTMDSLRDVHWKLSAKEEKLMVKERSFPLGCAVLIWFDFRKENCTAEKFSAMIKKAASLSATLLEQRCIHMAAWYEEKNSRIVKWRIDDGESACNMIWHLLDAEPCGDTEKRDACYKEAFLGTEFSSVAVIDGEGNLWRDGEKTEFPRL